MNVRGVWLFILSVVRTWKRDSHKTCMMCPISALKQWLIEAGFSWQVCTFEVSCLVGSQTY
jgi:hypothetical protein